MPPTFVVGDDFNSYADQTAYNVVWGGAGNLIAAGNPGGPPDGSQYIKFEALGGGDQTSLDTPWGTSQALATRTFTGLTPLTNYEIRFLMQVGTSADNGVGAFPGAHTFTAGLTANGTHLYVGVWVPVGPLGPTYVTTPPADIVAGGAITPWQPPTPIGTLFGSLDGWKAYSFTAKSDVNGHMPVSFGKYDGHNFSSVIMIDSFSVYTIPVPTSPTKHKKRPQVFGVGR